MCLLLTATCLAAGAQGSYANTPSEESQERPPAVDDVVFDLPDLVATLDTPHGDQYRLEAFQIASNQHVVSSANNGSVKVSLLFPASYSFHSVTVVCHHFVNRIESIS